MLTFSGPCEPDTARQRTALAALHALEAADLELLQPPDVRATGRLSKVDAVPDAVKVVELGDPHGREVTDGVCVKVRSVWCGDKCCYVSTGNPRLDDSQ